MAKNYLLKLTGVIGLPVDGNPTVAMQEAAFAANNLPWRYITMQVVPQDLQAALLGLRALNFSGINLTMPHKVAAVSYMDEIAPSAKIIGAINTVVIEESRMIGYNTDGQGFVNGMKEAGVSLAGKRLVVLGAGGAARAICVECALAGAAEILIINRDEKRGNAVAKLVQDNTPCVSSYIHWQGTASIPDCDILINATSVGIAADTDAPDICYSDIHKGMVVQDIITRERTLFMQKAEQMGAKAFSGLGMLVHQGAIGFKLWTGEDASLDAMYQALLHA